MIKHQPISKMISFFKLLQTGGCIHYHATNAWLINCRMQFLTQCHARFKSQSIGQSIWQNNAKKAAHRARERYNFKLYRLERDRQETIEKQNERASLIKHGAAKALQSLNKPRLKNFNTVEDKNNGFK